MPMNSKSVQVPEALRRRIPDLAELASLIRLQPAAISVKSRLARAQSIWDLRTLAKRRTPRAAFDFADGASGDEFSLERVRRNFADVEFRPNVLRNVSDVSLGVELFGRELSLPFGIAPTGFTRLMHSEGEYAGCRAAEVRSVPYALSTMGTASIEEVCQTAPSGENWFQLYLWKDRDRSMDLIRRAEQAGIHTLLVTVDTPVSGRRLRDLRNGLTIPPALSLSTVVDASYRPSWWFNFITREPVTFKSLTNFSGSMADTANMMFDPALDFDDLSWLREIWNGELIVKGIQDVDDAKRCAELGADGIVLSSHGGRQLDRGPLPLQNLPEVVEALQGKAAVILDSGIMNGADIVTALALGADFTLIGRAYLYGLMAGGLAGVERAFDILQAEIETTMKLLGVNDVKALSPDHVRLLAAHHTTLRNQSLRTE